MDKVSEFDEKKFDQMEKTSGFAEQMFYRAEQISGFKSDLSQLKKEKQTINDKVLELNVRTEIELVADVVNLLTQEGLV